MTPRKQKPKPKPPVKMFRVHGLKLTRGELKVYKRILRANHRKVAERVGITAAYVSFIFSGSRTPSLTVARKVCKALGDIDINDFVNTIKKMKDKKEREEKELGK